MINRKSQENNSPDNKPRGGAFEFLFKFFETTKKWFIQMYSNWNSIKKTEIKPRPSKNNNIEIIDVAAAPTKGALMFAAHDYVRADLKAQGKLVSFAPQVNSEVVNSSTVFKAEEKKDKKQIRYSSNKNHRGPHSEVWNGYSDSMWNYMKFR